jgi:hypothetical protein
VAKPLTAAAEMGKRRYERSLFVRDNFYADPERIVAFAKSMTYYEPKAYTGYIGKEAFGQECRVADRPRMTDAFWRMGWDSNPRDGCPSSGFQDRCLKPLGHPSIISKDI